MTSPLEAWTRAEAGWSSSTWTLPERASASTVPPSRRAVMSPDEARSRTAAAASFSSMLPERASTPTAPDAPEIRTSPELTCSSTVPTRLSSTLPELVSPCTATPSGTVTS